MKRGRGEGHVLVITANEGRRIRVVRLLARAGYSVQLAITLREALHSLAHGNTAWWQEPDVILLDQESLGAAACVSCILYYLLAGQRSVVAERALTNGSAVRRC